MLKTLYIEAYPIAIYAGDPTFVKAEWASPRQFNHCIIAVKVSDSVTSGTVIEHPKLGRLLIFDATDPYTAVGDLPTTLQGSYGLIIAGDNGGLSKMPETHPDADLLERKVEVELGETGELKGKINEVASGQASAALRGEVRTLSPSQYRTAIEGWLTRGATGARLVNVSHKDDQAASTFSLDVEFSTPRYAQLMQNRLLVFKPAIVGRRNSVVLSEPKRKTPIEIESGMIKESAVFLLPSGFVVDEMPDPVKIDVPFGVYETSYEIKDGKLHYSRSMTMKRTLVPVKDYGSVREFFSKVRDAEQSPVVLIRK
jgi:hypothetical protein